MEEKKKDLIEDLKIAIIYGKNQVDSEIKDGVMERIYKSGIFYMPKSISKKQRLTLIKMQKQLGDENYNITELFNLHRDAEGILLGNQLQGKSNILDTLTKDEELER